MSMPSSRRIPIAPIAFTHSRFRPHPRPRLRPRGPRHHASEAWRPRPTDLCADRMKALVTCVTLHGPLVMPNGDRVDAHLLESMANEQRARELDLQEAFGRTRMVYEDYHRATRRVREVLLHGIEHFDKHAANMDAVGRAALRTAKLRSPPKAKVAQLEAITAKRRNDDPG